MRVHGDHSPQLYLTHSGFATLPDFTGGIGGGRGGGCPEIRPAFRVLFPDEPNSLFFIQHDFDHGPFTFPHVHDLQSGFALHLSQQSPELAIFWNFVISAPP